MDDEWIAFQQKKCPICGGWKDFAYAWMDLNRSLCGGHPYDPIMVIGSTEPLGWINKQGELRANPDYIAPALRHESAQYEQALVGYELCEKASK